jgi:hypothetical protein
MDGERMSDEQIEILAQVVADVPAALKKLEDFNPELAERIRSEQEDAADTMRRAQSNDKLLRLRVLGRWGAGDLTNLL